MTEELEMKLVREFPYFFRDYRGDMRTTCMAWGMEHGNGWFDVFYKLNVDIAAHLEFLKLTYQEVPEFYWSQVKEKYGTACWYYQGGDQIISDLVSNAEDKTHKICEQCGKAGQLRGNGWYYTACEDHITRG
jgi:hypothetical protein